jgi:hypothetical protein
MREHNRRETRLAELPSTIRRPSQVIGDDENRSHRHALPPVHLTRIKNAVQWNLLEKRRVWP